DFDGSKEGSDPADFHAPGSGEGGNWDGGRPGSGLRSCHRGSKVPFCVAFLGGLFHRLPPLCTKSNRWCTGGHSGIAYFVCCHFVSLVVSGACFARGSVTL